jgi:hypothetical protein|tara:strand:+ start:6340 stop:6495 length:156 start_codon:yes stop_codon:yes gene_type:complete
MKKNKPKLCWTPDCKRNCHKDYFQCKKCLKENKEIKAPPVMASWGNENIPR